MQPICGFGGALPVAERVPVRSHLARCATSRGEGGTVRNAVETHFERAVEGSRRVGGLVCFFCVVRELSFRDTVRKADALFLKKLASIIRTAATAAPDLFGT